MKRTKLRNKFLKERTDESKKNDAHHNEIVAFHCYKRQIKIIIKV